MGLNCMGPLYMDFSSIDLQSSNPRFPRVSSTVGHPRLLMAKSSYSRFSTAGEVCAPIPYCPRVNSSYRTAQQREVLPKCWQYALGHSAPCSVVSRERRSLVFSRGPKGYSCHPSFCWAVLPVTGWDTLCTHISVHTRETEKNWVPTRLGA